MAGVENETKGTEIRYLQEKAVNMDAQTLARDFKGTAGLMGTVDTQHLLITVAPEEIQTEVRRLKNLLGLRFNVSPSHEKVLPDMPPENIKAMCEAMTRGRLRVGFFGNRL